MKKVQVHTKDTIQHKAPAPAVTRPILNAAPEKPVATVAPLTPVEPAGVTTALNPHLPLVSDASPSAPIITLQPQKHTQPHRHMHVKPSTKANHLNWLIERFAERWAETHALTPADFAHPSQTSQEEVLYVGRIVSDNDEKLTETSVLLEASRSGGSGARIPLDLSRCPSYSLFPGQLVVLSGRNPDGSKIVVSQVKAEECLISEMPALEPMASPLSLLVAAGPYSMDVNGTFDLAPLDRLLLLALERKPDVLLLMGPFIDAENEAVKLGKLPELPESLFKSQVMGKLTVLRQRCPHTKIVLVPALGELTHDYSLPQCAYQPTLVSQQESLLAGNPGTLQIGDFYLSVGTTDVLLRLGLSELQKAPQPADRFGRLAGHIYGQSSFYPLLPAHDGTNIEWAHAEGLQFPLRPDCILMPSALKNFARSVQETMLFVNPGQFCRKQGFGSAALLSVQPRTAQTPAFSQRCRVDMIQF